jgi:hypothetical protein
MDLQKHRGIDGRIIDLKEIASEVVAVFVCFHMDHWHPLVNAIMNLQDL